MSYPNFNNGVVPSSGSDNQYLQIIADSVVNNGSGGGGQPQTPWLSDIDAADFELRNVMSLGIGAESPNPSAIRLLMLADVSQFLAFLGNTDRFGVGIGATPGQAYGFIQTGRTGQGFIGPLAINAQGGNSTNVMVGSTTDNGVDKFQVAGSSSFAGNVGISNGNTIGWGTGFTADVEQDRFLINNYGGLKIGVGSYVQTGNNPRLRLYSVYDGNAAVDIGGMVNSTFTPALSVEVGSGTSKSATFFGPIRGGIVMTSVNTGTVTFNSSGNTETIYNTSIAVISSATITLPSVSVAGQIVRYVTLNANTTVSVTGGTVIIGAAVTTLPGNGSIAYQAVDTGGNWIRLY